jgi:hypothetical protein
MTWQEKIGCFSPNYITEKVMGVEQHFYPVSVGLMFKLRTIGKPLARSLAFLFGKNDNDVGSKSIFLSREEGLSPDQEITSEPISEGLAKLRLEQKESAIEGIIASLTDETHLEVVGKIIMDSMRDVFPKEEKSDRPPAKEFIDTLPLPALTCCLIGVAKANKGVFGPLAEQVTEAITASVARIGKANETQPDDLHLTPKQEESQPNPTATGG